MKMIRAIHSGEFYECSTDNKNWKIRIDFEDNTSKYLCLDYPISNEQLAKAFIELSKGIK